MALPNQKSYMTLPDGSLDPNSIQFQQHRRHRRHAVVVVVV